MSDWAGHRVFLTGATGLLGSHLAAALLERGALVTCLVRDWVPESEAVARGTLSRCRVVRGELEDYQLVLRALNEHEIDSVFHLGAQAIVGTATISPLSTFEANIKGTWTVLEAARQLPRIERVIVASSDKAYGPSANLPYAEDAPLAGRYPYDVSKSCADLIALSYYHTYGLPVAVTRCGNLFGGGDLNFNRLVPGAMRSALQGRAPTIRSDGTLVRDYFFVQDAVDAYLTLGIRVPEAGFVGEAFNFGLEHPLTVLEMVGRVLAAAGRPELPVQVLDQARAEIPRQYLSCEKARRLLGWSPRWELEDALRVTAAWYASYLDVPLPDHQRA